MHDRVHLQFRDLCRRYAVGGGVLEIGAVPDGSTLLALPELSGAKSRLGINLDGPASFGGFEIVGGNANAMPFADGAFDLVLCNATLEHDPRFWLTLTEMRRVLRTDGIAMIGVPGYVRGTSAWAKLAGVAGRLLRSAWLDGVAASTPVLLVHDFPGDYYRFSEQALREVLFEGFELLEQRAVMAPPRLIGVGRKLG